MSKFKVGDRVCLSNPIRDRSDAWFKLHPFKTHLKYCEDGTIEYIGKYSTEIYVHWDSLPANSSVLYTENEMLELVDGYQDFLDRIRDRISSVDKL